MDNKYSRGKQDRPHEKGRENENLKDNDKSKDKESYKEVRGKNVQFFKCLEKGHYSSECPLHRRNMILKEQNISPKAHSSSSSSEEDAPTFEEKIQPCTRELLVVKRILHNTPLKLEESQ